MRGLRGVFQWGTERPEAGRLGRGQLVWDHECWNISLCTLRHMDSSKWSFKESNQASLSGTDDREQRWSVVAGRGRHVVGSDLTMTRS